MNDAARAAALCNPCREGGRTEGCETCSALAAMIGAAVAQFFPDADPSTVQVHMAGTPPWEREGWEDALDAEIAAEDAEAACAARLEEIGYIGITTRAIFHDGWMDSLAWWATRPASPPTIACGATHPDPDAEARYRTQRAAQGLAAEGGCGAASDWRLMHRCLDCWRWMHAECLRAHFKESRHDHQE